MSDIIKFFYKDFYNDNNKNLIIKYITLWIIGLILITLLYLIINRICNYFDIYDIGFDNINKVKLRSMTPIYPPPLNNFIDSNDFIKI